MLQAFGVPGKQFSKDLSAGKLSTFDICFPRYR